MRRRTLTGLTTAACALALLAGLAPAATAGPPAHDRGPDRHGRAYRSVGYFTQWGVYGRDFQVKDLDTSGAAARLTHINYAFGNVSAEGRCFTGNVPGEADAWADYARPLDAAGSVDGVADTDTQPLAGNFNQLRELKAAHPGLKVMISLGGWSWSTHFSDAARTAASRKALVSSCIDLYIKGDLPVDGARGGEGAAAGLFDGIDLDWEWPGSAGDTDTVYRPEDKRNFTALVHEFRTQLDAHAKSARKGKPKHYELSAFVPTAPAKIDAGFDVPRIMRDFDFVNLQGYDFHVSGETTTAQQSALYAKGDFSVDRTVRDWIRRGAPARKLVMGMPFYGQGWTGVTGGGDGLGQPATAPAPATWAAGYEDYKALKKLAASGKYTVHRDVKNGHAWLFDGTTLWTYDDPQVLRAKTSYIRERGLGGAMFWSLDGDTDDGELMAEVARGLGRR
ncbi:MULTISPECIES: glycoside hydrolase family 18 protein [Streptomyces]|uniref:chitinase n=1 Tax=Streptomyces glycanivorans TaxID=3033808 RepID=A0ABY9JEH5_9ACTN|nr:MULTISPECIES: glycoside hydrolase family 18 protein [unclassified Streptomyces]WSQ77778.1 glycoside hydrolase family 18 protein [Streptomyces sp. NBC_01213]TXS17860.1 glycoside hydrolase family 18 protein [Streptomyces sp. wa22]WLQ64396.1 glycoside hydrolase family 18 protein [Streptomyces sp. Alt3]WSQ85148.1 glycoside hydrolase family 18 protein [Streptomyces sp. NBC_01212]WSR08777.1 glycoside hydrolase family 18 protein [Streptomyces sp. NBC_01208]